MINLSCLRNIVLVVVSSFNGMGKDCEYITTPLPSNWLLIFIPTHCMSPSQISSGSSSQCFDSSQLMTFICVPSRNRYPRSQVSIKSCPMIAKSTKTIEACSTYGGVKQASSDKKIVYNSFRYMQKKKQMN